MTERSPDSSGSTDPVTWTEYRKLCVEDWTHFYDLPLPRDEEGTEVPTVVLEQVRDAIRTLRQRLYREVTFTPEQQMAVDFACRYKAWFDAFAFQMLGESKRYQDVEEVIRTRREFREEGPERH